MHYFFQSARTYTSGKYWSGLIFCVQSILAQYCGGRQACITGVGLPHCSQRTTFKMPYLLARKGGESPHSSRLGIDASDALSLPDIGPDFALDKLQLIQEPDGLTIVRDLPAEALSVLLASNRFKTLPSCLSKLLLQP